MLETVIFTAIGLKFNITDKKFRSVISDYFEENDDNYYKILTSTMDNCDTFIFVSTMLYKTSHRDLLNDDSNVLFDVDSDDAFVHVKHIDKAKILDNMKKNKTFPKKIINYLEKNSEVESGFIYSCNM